MFSVKIGTTNINGTGTSENLTSTNAEFEYVSYADVFEDGSDGDDLIGSATSSTYSGQELSDPDGEIYAAASSWNAKGAKELKVDAQNVDVNAVSFVDVDINLAGSVADLDVMIEGSKRGSIETGLGDDMIHVYVETNNSGWTNKFVVDSGEGNDDIFVADAANVDGKSQYTSVDINSGAGDDLIDITGLKDSYDSSVTRIINSEGGDDTILGSGGGDTILAGSGSDNVFCFDGNDYIKGESGEDYIEAGAGNDIILGGSESDEIYAGEGDDVVMAGTGDDEIYGESGDDILQGYTGNDTIYGGSGNDVIIDYSGNNKIFGGSGDDVIHYNSADDEVDGGSGLDALVISGAVAFGDDTIVDDFEAYVSQDSSVNSVYMNIENGLVVALGGDDGDALYLYGDFDNVVEVDTALSDQMIALLESIPLDSNMDGDIMTAVDIDTLQAYEYNDNGFTGTFWTDVDMLA